MRSHACALAEPDLRSAASRYLQPQNRSPPGGRRTRSGNFREHPEWLPRNGRRFVEIDCPCHPRRRSDGSGKFEKRDWTSPPPPPERSDSTTCDPPDVLVLAGPEITAE